MLSAVKVFDVEEGSLPGGWYKITVKFNGRVVSTFKRPTMDDAHQAFRRAGYQAVAWAEGGKIVCQEER